MDLWSFEPDCLLRGVFRYLLCMQSKSICCSPIRWGKVVLLESKVVIELDNFLHHLLLESENIQWSFCLFPPGPLESCSTLSKENLLQLLLKAINDSDAVVKATNYRHCDRTQATRTQKEASQSDSGTNQGHHCWYKTFHQGCPLRDITAWYSGRSNCRYRWSFHTTLYTLRGTEEWPPSVGKSSQSVQ